MVLHTYRFKHPVTKQWVEFQASSFDKALILLRQIN
jgi:hypothetical protein